MAPVGVFLQREKETHSPMSSPSKLMGHHDKGGTVTFKPNCETSCLLESRDSRYVTIANRS